MFSSNAQMSSLNAPQMLKCSRSPAHLSDRTFFDQSPSQLTNECSHQSHLQRTEKYFKNCLSNQTFSLLRMFSGRKDALWPSLKSELRSILFCINSLHKLPVGGFSERSAAALAENFLLTFSDIFYFQTLQSQKQDVRGGGEGSEDEARGGHCAQHNSDHEE